MTGFSQQSKARRSRRAGLALIELLLVMVMTAVLAGALSYAFGAEMTMQRLTETRRGQSDQTQTMEREITRTLTAARLSGITGDTTSFFQGVNDSGGSDLGVDRLTFTTTEPGVPIAAINDTDDFETQEIARGPIGGLTEISLATTAVGNAGSQTGLFERIQRPSDSDPTQGGNESVLDADIDQIGFQFWDGLEWTDTWDTTTMTTPTLPQAVQVSYRLKSESDAKTHLFVVPIAASTVNSQNPYDSSSDSAAATGGTAG